MVGREASECLDKWEEGNRGGKADGVNVPLGQELHFDLHSGPLSKKVNFMAAKSVLKTFSQDKFNILK